VTVFAIWEPILSTDWSTPGAQVLSRLPDARVHQFWDKEHLVAQRLAADARDPQPTPKCCNRNGTLWDLAAVYPAGARWDDKMPPAEVFNGPVVKVQGDVESALQSDHIR